MAREQTEQGQGAEKSEDLSVGGHSIERQQIEAWAEKFTTEELQSALDAYEKNEKVLRAVIVHSADGPSELTTEAIKKALEIKQSKEA